MRYRAVTDLTNEEIRQVMVDIFHPTKVKNIRRHKRENYVSLVITTEWEADEEGEKPFPVDDSIEISENGFQLEPDFYVDGTDRFRLKQFLVAKGCDPYLKDNPYLQEE